MVPVRAFRFALFCSFVVYFIPIIGPHAIFFIWESLGQHFREFSKNPGWALTELGATLLLQVAALAFFYWFFRRRSVLRIPALLLCGFLSVYVVQYLFFAVIPAQFMIEKETAQETTSWPEACRVTDASVTDLRTSRRMPKEGRSEAWVRGSDAGYSILRMPDCQKIPAPLPKAKVQPGGRVDFMNDLTQSSPGGLALVQHSETASGKDGWWLLNVPAATLTPLPTPPLGTTRYVQPYLSDDGRETAWVLVIDGTGPPVLEQIHFLPVEGNAPERVVDLTPFGPNTYEPVSYDSKSGDVLLWASQPLPGHLLAIGRDGKERPAPTIPATIKPQSHSMLLLESGVVAWDAYREDESYSVSWATGAGSGSHKIPKGSAFTSVAADPSGRYIAVSTTTQLNIGSTKDTVFVLRASDGKEVFRRFLPTYNRTGVVFLGREWFAYSDFGTTHVLRIE